MKMKTMARRKALWLVLTLTATTFFFGFEKTTSMCHHEGDKPAFTITCAFNLIPWHLTHGDRLGACSASPHY